MFEAFSRIFSRDHSETDELVIAQEVLHLEKMRNRQKAPNMELSPASENSNSAERHGPVSNKEFFMDPNWKRDPSNALSNLKSLSQKQGHERKFLRPSKPPHARNNEQSSAQIQRIESEDKAPIISPERQRKAILDLLNINGDHHSITA